MARSVSRADYPWWVKLSLWGVPGGRSGQWFFVGLSVAFAVACVIYGFWDRRFFLGMLFLLSAMMYWLTIRWIDRHGSWRGRPNCYMATEVKSANRPWGRISE
jgi:hypothetical protein